MENQHNLENAPFMQETKTTFDKEKITGFYKQGLPVILKRLVKEPVNGIQSLLSEKNESSYFNAIVLMATTAILYILIPYLMMGEMRKYVGFGEMIKIGMCILILMFVISTLVFVIKSISGKPLFKNELLTGALCGIPLSLLIILTFLLQFFAKDSFSFNTLSFPSAMRTLEDLGAIAGLFGLYVILMLINIIQQSLTAAKSNEAIAWYSSPVILLISFYITLKTSIALFF